MRTTTLTWTRDQWHKMTPAQREPFTKRAQKFSNIGPFVKIAIDADLYERYLRMQRSAEITRYGKS